MSRSIQLYLNDILESISKIQKTTQGKNKKYLFDNEIIFDGIILNLQIIGESVKQIPSPIREQYPQIDWSSIIGLRNVISHAYFSFDLNIIWDIIQTEINPLKIVIQHIQSNEISN